MILHHLHPMSLRTLPLLLLLSAASFTAAQPPSTTSPTAQQRFVPADSFLINCGAPDPLTTPDGRSFRSDKDSTSFLSAKDEIRATIPSAPSTAQLPSPLYLSARIFHDAASYTFRLTRPGWHWIRLHFFPLSNPDFDLTRAAFSVTTDDHVLLHSFTVDNPNRWEQREYLVNATTDHINLHFSPLRNSAAYINAIELVSAPDILLPDTASSLFPVGDADGLSAYAYQTSIRLNMGGPVITPVNDTLGRYWSPDAPYLALPSAAKSTSLKDATAIQYPDGTSPLIAPNWIYATAQEMADANIAASKFNVTWRFDVDASFGYLVRLHFCDIISKSMNQLYFNAYINGMTAISGLDLSTLTDGLSRAYYRDFILNASLATDRITVSVGLMQDPAGVRQALLNGLEIFKMSNSIGSLDGEFGVDGSRASDGSSGGTTRHVVVAVGFAMMFGAFAGLGAMVVKWHKRPHDWEKRNSFSSWLLPIHAGHSSFMTSNSHKSAGHTFSSTLGLGLGRLFSFSELQDATKNFDEKAVIGVGGFGNVYIGTLDDGVQVAVKRGNPQSEQGINEFQTEIQMLSKLRHRHLVSLIGYCDENSEMILVYEYMSNGPFRDHIYGKDEPSLSWKQRLEICIGAARGLHYLHTGTATGIIHRDVKTTNILLDENFVAKVSDFGLSKDAPGMNQTHVSTAVKGSFGYLDPEYFRRQQLTDKSDVYSFGVVLMEALCARPALDPALPREQVNLAEWALKWKRKGLLEKIVDPAIAGTINAESMNKFAEAAEKCLAEYGVDRPSMGDVLWNLEYALQLQEANPPAPPPPAAAKPAEEGAAEVDEEAAPAVATDAPQISSQSVENSSTAVANELFAQLAGMKGR